MVECTGFVLCLCQFMVGVRVDFSECSNKLIKCRRGLLTTYGAFQEYYQTALLPDQSPSAISWVGSLQATLIPMVGIISGPLVDSGYLRPLMISGSFFTVFGMMMTSLATEYYQVSSSFHSTSVPSNLI